MHRTVFGARVAQSSHSFDCAGVVGITVVNTVFGVAVGTVCLGHSVYITVHEHSVLDDLGVTPYVPHSLLCVRSHSGSIDLKDQQISDRSLATG